MVGIPFPVANGCLKGEIAHPEELFTPCESLEETRAAPQTMGQAEVLTLSSLQTVPLLRGIHKPLMLGLNRSMIQVQFFLKQTNKPIKASFAFFIYLFPMCISGLVWRSEETF